MNLISNGILVKLVFIFYRIIWRRDLGLRDCGLLRKLWFSIIVIVISIVFWYNLRARIIINRRWRFLRLSILLLYQFIRFCIFNNVSIMMFTFIFMIFIIIIIHVIVVMLLLTIRIVIKTIIPLYMSLFPSILSRKLFFNLLPACDYILIDFSYLPGYLLLNLSLFFYVGSPFVYLLCSWTYSIFRLFLNYVL